MINIFTSLKFLAQVLFGIFLLFNFTSCEDDDMVDLDVEFTVPDNYVFTRDGNSTVSYSGQTDRLAMAAELVSAMSDPANGPRDLSDLFRNPEGTDPFTNPALNASTKSIRSKVAASADLYATNTAAAAEIRNTFDGFLEAQATEVFPAWNELAAPGQAGQVADGNKVRYVNAGGLEYNQAFAKSLIGGLMYDQLVNNYLSPAVLDAGNNRDDNDAGTAEEGKAYTSMEHKWDEAFGYLFGGSANPTTPLSDLGTADDFLNKYLGRVEADADYTGMAERIEAAFRKGRAAIVAMDYDERDAQADIIKSELKRIIPIRAIYYLMQGKALLEAEPANLGGAFHALSEGYGFIYSLRFIDGAAGASDDFITALENEAGDGFWTISPAALLGMANTIGLTYDINVSKAGE